MSTRRKAWVWGVVLVLVVLLCMVVAHYTPGSGLLDGYHPGAPPHPTQETR